MAPWSAQPQTILRILSFSSVDSWNPTSSKPTSQTYKEKKRRQGEESGEAVAFLYLFAIGSRFFFFSDYLCLDSAIIRWIGWIQTYGSEKIGLSLLPQSEDPQNGLFSLTSHGSWVHWVLPSPTEPGEHHLGSLGSIHAKRKFTISSGSNILFLII